MLDFYEHCKVAKQHRVQFSTVVHRTKDTTEYIHWDLQRPPQVRSKEGARYMLTSVNAFSHIVQVNFLKTRMRLLSVSSSYLLTKDQTGKKMKRLRKYNRLELRLNKFDEFCRENRIDKHHTMLGKPQRNVIAEWWTQLCFGEPNVLSNTGLSRDFWAEAVTLACHLIYRSLTSAIEFQIPKEVWTGQSTYYSSLQVFGCPIYAHVRDGKLEPRAKKCIPWLCMR